MLHSRQTPIIKSRNNLTVEIYETQNEMDALGLNLRISHPVKVLTLDDELANTTAYSKLILNLPPELTNNVVSHLDGDDVICLALVRKKFYSSYFPKLGHPKVRMVTHVGGPEFPGISIYELRVQQMLGEGWVVRELRRPHGITEYTFVREESLKPKLWTLYGVTYRGIGLPGYYVRGVNEVPPYFQGVMVKHAQRKKYRGEKNVICLGGVKRNISNDSSKVLVPLEDDDNPDVSTLPTLNVEAKYRY